MADRYECKFAKTCFYLQKKKTTQNCPVPYDQGTDQHHWTEYVMIIGKISPKDKYRLIVAVLCENILKYYLFTV